MIALTEVDDLDHHGPADHDVVGLEVEMYDSVELEVTHSLSEHEEDVDLGTEGKTEFLREHVFDEVGQHDIIRQQVILEFVLLCGDVILGNEQGIPALDLPEYILLMLNPILHLPPLHRLLSLDNHHLPDHLLRSESLIISRRDHLVVVT